MKYKKWIIAALTAFIVWCVVDSSLSKYLGDGSNKTYIISKKIPMMHPHYRDDLYTETLTLKKTMFREFGASGSIRFHVNKYKNAEGRNADGVTLEVYADSKLIASKSENPYDEKNDLYDPKYRSVSFDFSIPSNTQIIVVKALKNGNTGWDHTYIEKIGGRQTNIFGTLLFAGALLGLLFLLYSYKYLRSNISLIAKNIYVKIKDAPSALQIFGGLCLFLLLYARFNINLMPIVFGWMVWKLGFFKWLESKFGKDEARLALWIGIGAAIFFVVMMHYFRVAIVMDVLWGDSNRVYGDFTQVAANHYRTKVHPLYVLVWQSLYHLFAPITLTSSYSLRCMIAIFAGINVAIFALFISRLVKNRWAIGIGSALLAFSYPQIYQGAQMVEGFIFTQTSILLCLLYFSFAIPEKRYNLAILLAIALFVIANNIAYICIFGIFYLFLLYATKQSWKETLIKIAIFSLCFIALFSIILYIQYLVYGHNSPSTIYKMWQGIKNEEGKYINTTVFAWRPYIKSFFGQIFANFPFGFPQSLKYGYLWAILLLIPCILYKRIKERRMFVAIVATCVFLFIFHFFYGVKEIYLYSPVYIPILLCLFAYMFQVLSVKKALYIGGTFLALLVVVNIHGAVKVSRINNAVFGNMDVGNWKDFKQKIDEIKLQGGINPDLKSYFQDTNQLRDEIVKAYNDNVIDLVFLPQSEIDKAPNL